jgi:hypothetical protein
MSRLVVHYRNGSSSSGQADLQLTAAPLAVKDKIVLGAAGGDHGGS